MRSQDIYLMIPVDKEAISTPTLQPELCCWTKRTQTVLSVIAEDTSHLTTFDYLGVYASCQAVNSPDSQSQSGGVLVIFWRAQKDVWFHRYSPKGREEMEGNTAKGKKMKKRHVMGSTSPLLPTKWSVCNHYSSVSLFLSWADFFSLIPAKAGVALTTQELSDLWYRWKDWGESYLVNW